MKHIEKVTETCGKCNKPFTGEKIADDKAEFDRTGWFNAVEKTLLFGLCQGCLDNLDPPAP